MNDAWDHLLDEARTAHERLAELQEFCTFPRAVRRQQMDPKHDPLSDRLRADRELSAAPEFAPFRDALCAAASDAKWRDTYRDTNFGETLHANFGCYEVIGTDTPLGADTLRSFVIYQVPGFHYPMHHHPAEELYLVVAGEGEFHMEGQPSRHLTPGDTAFHPSNVPHALTTHDTPILAYVLWRGDLGTKPVWSHPEALA